MGQKGVFLGTEYKNEVLDPVIERIADHVFNRVRLIPGIHTDTDTGTRYRYISIGICMSKHISIGIGMNMWKNIGIGSE